MSRELEEVERSALGARSILDILTSEIYTRYLHMTSIARLNPVRGVINNLQHYSLLKQFKGKVP